MSETRWLDAREARLWQSYRDVHRELLGALENRLIANAGLSGADYALLHPLSTAADGVLRTRDLCREIGWERSRLSHQVSRMERRGLVCREECAADARGSMVRITEAGRTAIEAAAPDHVDAVRTYLFDRLSRDEQDALAGLLTKIAAGLPDRPACPSEVRDD